MNIKDTLLQCYKQHGEAFLRRIVIEDKTWIFNYTPESKAKSMTWKHPQFPIKKKFKTIQSPGKVTATALWDVYGVLLVDFIPPGSADAYQETLKRLKEAIQKKRPRLSTTVLLLHENARAHSAATTVNS